MSQKHYQAITQAFAHRTKKEEMKREHLQCLKYSKGNTREGCFKAI